MAIAIDALSTPIVATSVTDVDAAFAKAALAKGAAFEPKYAGRMDVCKPSAIRELLALGNDPSVVSFGGGFPDKSLFPVEALAASFANAFTEDGNQALQYTSTSGIEPLREAIAKLVNADGIQATKDDILVLQGGQQGLDLVCKLVVDKGDKIVVENPTFLGALASFNPYEPQYLTVEADSQGMIADDLETQLRANPDAKLIYLVPDFNNPTGNTLSLERRRRIIELAKEYDVLILEDSPYRALRYEGDHVPTLYSLCPSHVVHLSSFSKVLAPGLRLGYAIALAPILDRLSLLKLAADTQSSTIVQYATVRFLRDNDLSQQVELLKNAYRQKKNTMMAAMKKEFPSSVKFTNPEGGLFLWVTFPEGFDSGDFLFKHAIPKAKVAYVPGRPFSADGQCSNSARFSFSSASDEQIVQGIVRLGALLREYNF